jgi:RNA polymerase primary sigma factor
VFEEVNNALPSNFIAPEQIDGLMNVFGANEIHVVDSDSAGKKLVSENNNSEEKESAPSNTTANKSESVSIDDPVRMYLREMGTISLLTREGEVTIAKKIEAGQHEVIASVANCSITLKEITQLGEQTKRGEINLFDVIQISEPEEKKIEIESQETKKFFKRIKIFKANGKKLKTIRSKITPKLKSKTREKYEKEVVSQISILQKSLRSMKLSPDIMDNIIEKIYAIAAEIRLAGKLERDFEREWGATLASIKKHAGRLENEKKRKTTTWSNLDKEKVRKPITASPARA